ncbi:L,D-transpeptidase family protein [Methylomonas sp. AM2-LC]|uniref:L,D-transpeptidase family protein n=1 Tax=Methylomonas sp. AM2-LC TaxID=3153301 RepID=UPI0032646032
MVCANSNALKGALKIRDSVKLTLTPLGLVLLLSGCQLFPSAQQSILPPSVEPIKQESIDSHTFYLSPDQNVVGTLASVTARETDTLSDIARNYGLGYNDITLANQNSEPWALTNEQTILLPLRFVLPDTPHQGMVLNLANMRMFYYPHTPGGTLLTFPVGIGRQGWNTPLGSTQIMSKKANPDWTVPASIKREHLMQGDVLPNVIHSGPDNPLGNYAFSLGFKSILIHGTNKPYGIGMQVSHGCIQLYPEDIEFLFNKVEVGTPVKIVYQPYMVAWEGDMLYVEAHPSLEKWAKQQNSLQKDLRNKLKKLAAEKHAIVDWKQVDSILQRSDGIPSPVLVNSPDAADISAKALLLQHPDKLLNQPQVMELTDQDWSIVTNPMQNRAEAQKLAAMLNHQEPQIPARFMDSADGYKVIAGPFKDSQEAKLNAKRIKHLFELDVTVRAPRNSAYCINQMLKSVACKMST